MNFRFYIIGSSSSGNCALLETPESRVLIDAGFSCRRIKKDLASLDIDVETLDAVFLTHEHSDHVAGLNGLGKLERPIFFATNGTAEEAQRPLDFSLFWQKFEAGATFQFRDICVSTFSIPHDAADPVGFTFSFNDTSGTRQTVAWATDLGHVTGNIRQKLRDVDVLALEANYDPEMLKKSGRPPSLQQRIRGRHGHLSNEQSASFLVELENEKLRHVFHAHLSGECNAPELVENEFAAARALRPQCKFTVIPSSAMAPIGFCA